MRRYRYFSVFILLAVAALFGIAYFGPGDDWIEKRSVRNVVEGFGGQLQKISLAANETQVREEIEANYRSYVSDELLDTWLAAPALAPGRETSSPWPARIEIDSITPQAKTYIVLGRVVLMTSAEEATGEDDNAGTVPVVIQLVKTEVGWRIAAYQEQITETPSSL